MIIRTSGFADLNAIKQGWSRQHTDPIRLVAYQDRRCAQNREKKNQKKQEKEKCLNIAGNLCPPSSMLFEMESVAFFRTRRDAQHEIKNQLYSVKLQT